MTTGRDQLTKAETVLERVPALVAAREVVAAFQAMVRAMTPAKLGGWIERASTTLLAAFARGMAKDKSAVRAALTLSWSNGQTEGQITKLKLVKRQMYGRGKIDLLEARLEQIEDQAAGLGTALPLFAVAKQLYDTALADGWGALDIAAVHDLLSGQDPTAAEPGSDP